MRRAKPATRRSSKRTTAIQSFIFSGRSRADIEHIAVRHILIMARKATATEAEIAAAKTKAESMLAEYLAGDKTEESFRRAGHSQFR